MKGCNEQNRYLNNPVIVFEYVGKCSYCRVWEVSCQHCERWRTKRGTKHDVRSFQSRPNEMNKRMIPCRPFISFSWHFSNLSPFIRRASRGRLIPCQHVTLPATNENRSEWLVGSALALHKPFVPRWHVCPRLKAQR